MVDAKEVTLAGVAGGSIDELFRAAQGKVLENLQDPNTDWKPRRRITITLDYSVEEDRRTGDIEIKCTTKLAGVKGVRAGIVIGRDKGVLKAVEQPGQADLFTNPTAARPELVGGSAKA